MERLTDCLYRHPFLRFVIPFIGGILLCDSLARNKSFTGTITVWNAEVKTFYIIGILLSLSLLFLIIFYVRRRYSDRWLFGVAITLLFVAMGMVWTARRQAQISYKWSQEKEFYVATLTENPMEKEKTIKCHARIVRQKIFSGEKHFENNTANLPSTYKNENTFTSSFSQGDIFVNRNVILYLPKDSASLQLKLGDPIVFYSKVRTPSAKDNPVNFDYAGFLRHKGVAGITFIRTNDWRFLSGISSLSGFRQAAFACREYVISLYRKLGFQKAELSVLSALTVGDKRELGKEIRRSYSVAGVSHLLALSGLHLGLIYFLFDFLLKRLERRHYTYWLKQGLLLIVLWSFAMMTGFSVSIVRAAIMFSLWIIANIFLAKPVPLNTLAIAAFIILIYDPYYLYDIGFQLSFLSVVGIVMIHPYLYEETAKRIKSRNKCIKYIVNLLTISIAAQIAVFPFVIHYFSDFSLYFLFSNLIAVPLVSLILYGAVGMILCGIIAMFFPYLFSFIAKVTADIISFFISLVNEWVSLIEKLPFSAIHVSYFNEIDMVLSYLFVICCLLYFIYKKRQAFLFALFFLLCGSTLQLWRTVSCIWNI